MNDPPSKRSKHSEAFFHENARARATLRPGPTEIRIPAKQVHNKVEKPYGGRRILGCSGQAGAGGQLGRSVGRGEIGPKLGRILEVRER